MSPSPHVQEEEEEEEDLHNDSNDDHAEDDLLLFAWSFPLQGEEGWKERESRF